MSGALVSFVGIKLKLVWYSQFDIRFQFDILSLIFSNHEIFIFWEKGELLVLETIGSQESLLRGMCVPNFIALRRSGGELNLANRQIKLCENDNFGPWGGERLFLGF